MRNHFSKLDFVGSNYAMGFYCWESAVNTVLTDVDGEKPFAGTLPAAREGELFASQESVCNDPNVESLEAIREGDAFLRSGKEGCFTNGADLIAAAMA